MKKMHGRLCIMIGAALLLAALSLVLYNLNKDSQGGKASQELLAELKLEMPQISSDDENLSNNDLFKEYEDNDRGKWKDLCRSNLYSVPSIGASCTQ